MSDLDAVVPKVLARARERHGGRTDGDALEDLLDYAFDELDYAGDEMDLVDAIRAATAPPRRAGPPPGRRGGGAPGGGGQRPRKAFDETEISAPYRFVALSPEIVPADPAAAGARLDRPLADGFRGEIEVEWRFETPLLVGQGVDVAGPTRLAGRPVIPGATLRGLVRASLETVAHGRLTQANAHHRYGVRDFEHPLFTDENRPGWDALGAAWLRLATDDDPAAAEGDSDWVLEPCDKRTIRIRDLPSDMNGGRPTDDGRWHKTWLNKELEDRYAAAGMRTGDTVDFTRSRGFRDTGEGADVTPAAGPFEGVLVFSGKSPTVGNLSPTDLDEQERNPKPGNQKKREYVFAARPRGPVVRLRRSVRDRFLLMNSKPARNRRVPAGSWAKLEPTLARRGRIPVFFVGDLVRQEESDLDIGLTRFFKRAHRHGVDDALHALGHGRPNPADPDVAEALFGHVVEDHATPRDDDRPGAARKGRVAVGFAELDDGCETRESEAVRTVMMAPRPSYAPFYLAGQVKDWSVPPKPAGRKRYPPRFPGVDPKALGVIRETLEAWRGEGRGELISTLRFLEPAAPGREIAFRGAIRLHNVTAVEVGALLWTLTHGGDPVKPFRHMIGRAKGAGAGQARVARLRLSLRPNAEAARAHLGPPEPWELPGEGREGWTDPDGIGLAPFLRAFEAHMRTRVPSWPDTEQLREHLGAASPALGKDVSRTWMRLPTHQRLRNAVKAADRLAAPAIRRPRLLAAPEVAPARPYARDGDGR